MKIKPFTCFLCAVTLILISLSPWLIMSYYERNPEAIPYKGILTLWHINDWRTGGSTAGSFLNKRIAEFEADNAYLFIELQTMTVSEAQKALRNGETPDLISYPLGFEFNLSLSSLPSRDILFSYITDCAYPYMCGGYCMLVNTDTLDEQGSLYPDDWGIRPDELLEITQYGVCFDSEDGYSALPAIALHQYPTKEGPNITTWGEPDLPDAALDLSEAVCTDGLEAFCHRQSCILVASHRQLFEANQLYEQGKSPAFSAYAISGYTDMVQMVGVPSCDDIKKQMACTAFAEYLVSDTVQKKLEALGVFPVVSGLEIYTDNTCLKAVYRLLSKSPALPSPENRQALDNLMKQSFNGDADALKKIRGLLGAVF
ncbi:MAG: hypothetical protein ACOX8Q_03565 [Christensenellales bacterium]|jgi:hypothetical protein